MSAQWHKCFHTMLFLIWLTCCPVPVRPATECWSSTVRTQTSEAAARSRSAVLITRRARPGVASLGLGRGETVTRQRLAMIHPRENNNTGTMQRLARDGDTYTRDTPDTDTTRCILPHLYWQCAIWTVNLNIKVTFFIWLSIWNKVIWNVRLFFFHKMFVLLSLNIPSSPMSLLIMLC